MIQIKSIVCVCGNNEFMMCWWFSYMAIDLLLLEPNIRRPFAFEICSSSLFFSSLFFISWFEIAFQPIIVPIEQYELSSRKRIRGVLISKNTGENLRWLCGYWFCWTRKKGTWERKTNVWQNYCISFGFNFFFCRLFLLFFSFSCFSLTLQTFFSLNTSLVCHNKLMCVSIRAVGIRTVLLQMSIYM